MFLVFLPGKVIELVFRNAVTSNAFSAISRVVQKLALLRFKLQIFGWELKKMNRKGKDQQEPVHVHQGAGTREEQGWKAFGTKGIFLSHENDVTKSY